MIRKLSNCREATSQNSLRGRISLRHKFHQKIRLGPITILLSAALSCFSTLATAETQPLDTATRDKVAWMVKTSEPEVVTTARLAEMAFLTQAVRNLGSTNVSAITDIVSAARTEINLNKEKTYGAEFNDAVEAFAALGRAAASKGTPFVRATAQAFDDMLTPNFAEYLEKKDALTNKVFSGDWYSLGRGERSNQIRDAFYDTCRQSAATAELCDRAMAATLGVSVMDSAAKICTDQPDMGGCVQLQSPTIDVAQLRAKFSAEVAAMQNVTKESISTLHAIDALQRTQPVIDYVNDEITRRKAEALAEKLQLTYDKRIKVARNVVSAVSGLIKHVDPKLGNEVGVVGSSAITIADNLSRFAKTVATIDRTKTGWANIKTAASAISSMSNVVGAAVQIIALFKPAQPSSDALILAEIKKISAQIRELRAELHDRLNRIDVRLDQIYAKLDEGLAQINYDTGVLQNSSDEIQRGLLGLVVDLHQFERNSHEFLDTGFRQDLLTVANGYIQYATRVGSPMPFQPEFVYAENQVHTWASIFAKDALRAGPFSRDFSENALSNQLSAFSLAFNVNFACDLPQRLFGLPACATERLSNPLDLAFATQAWLKLMEENPDHAQRIAQTRRAQLLSAAQKLKIGLQNLSNPALLKALLADYRDHADRFEATVNAARTQYQSDPTKKIALFDLFGSADQNTKYVPRIAQVASCDGSGMPISLPNKWLELFQIESRFVNAEALGFSEIRSCYFAQWSNLTTCTSQLGDEPIAGQVCTVFVRPDGSRKWACSCPIQGRSERFGYVQTANLKVSLQIEMPWKGRVTSIATRSWTSPKLCLDEHLDGRTPYYGTPVAANTLAAAWSGSWRGPGYCNNMVVNDVRDEFAMASLPSAPAIREANPTAHIEVGSEVAATLREHQLGFYSKVFNDLMAVTDIHASAQRLDGRKRSLESVLALGLPETYAHNSLVRGSLLGNERLPDSDMILQLYLDGASPSKEPGKVELAATAKKRANALEQSLLATTERIEKGELREGHSLIEGLVTQLQLAGGGTSESGGPIVMISLDKSNVSQGASAVLSWTATNALECHAIGSWTGTKPVNGSEVIRPPSEGQVSYGLTCIWSDGSSETKSVALSVTPQKANAPASGGGGCASHSNSSPDAILPMLLLLAAIGGIKHIFFSTRR